MYIYVHTNVYIYTHACWHTCIRTFMNIYACAYIYLHRCTVTATTIDLEDELEARYPRTFQKHKRAIESKGGSCFFGVDARLLAANATPYKDFRSRFEKVNVYIHIHMCIYIYLRIYINVYMNLSIYIDICICKYMYM